MTPPDIARHPSLAGRVAVVTGAASGIGAATVSVLTANDAVVLAADIDTERGSSVAEAHAAEFVELDVADAAQWERLASFITERFGRLDVLVNNAGIVAPNPIGEFDLESWHRVLAVNLTGTALGCHTAIRLMRGQTVTGPGAIVNVASTTALAGVPNDVGYVASKGGVRALTRSVAVYCARTGLDIRCNAVLPGATDTDIIDRAARAMPGVRDHLATISLVGRMATPGDIAATIAFMASDSSAYINGTDILVDGGAFAVHPGY